MGYHVLQVGPTQKVYVWDSWKCLEPLVQPGDWVIVPIMHFFPINTKYELDIMEGYVKSWAKKMASKLRCFVIVGCPKIIGGRLLSAATGINVDGMPFIRHYERQADEAFATNTWKDDAGLKINIVIGLCDDLSPAFCQYVLDERAEFVVFLMGECLEEESKGTEADSKAPSQWVTALKPLIEVDTKTLSQWVTALEPLRAAERPYPIIVVFANPSGSVGDAAFSGSSAAFNISHGGIHLYGVLPKGLKPVVFSFHNETKTMGRFACKENDQVVFYPGSENYFMDTTPINTAPSDKAPDTLIVTDIIDALPDTAPINTLSDISPVQMSPHLESSEVICASRRTSPSTSKQPLCFVDKPPGPRE